MDKHRDYLRQRFRDCRRHFNVGAEASSACPGMYDITALSRGGGVKRPVEKPHLKGRDTAVSSNVYGNPSINMSSRCIISYTLFRGAGSINVRHIPHRRPASQLFEGKVAKYV